MSDPNFVTENEKNNKNCVILTLASNHLIRV